MTGGRDLARDQRGEVCGGGAVLKMRCSSFLSSLFHDLIVQSDGLTFTGHDDRQLFDVA